ncbi:metal ABC transporter solute-binding protein, Zn/Mn family [Paraliobacillus zengyii]|uniref:metal ABC transporter solute-binding protein, Zn/Mn family n=1 Tax=Paraliobacillus zengyii TaxID=2213194 RepID=UPI000DD350F2|nr:zinc ABC transporter substrate-binding protein [Paraliobacillus zengyii]
MKLLMRFTLFMLVGGLLVACGSEEQAESESEAVSGTDSEEEKLQIYTTLYPLEYFANEIGGSYVEVTSILPAGADAHTYEPTSKTMVDIATADLFIYNGADLEAYAEKIQQALIDEDVEMVEAAEGLDLLNYEHEHEEESEEHAHDEEESEEHTYEEEEAESTEDDGHDHGDVDPHVWLDPMLSVSLAENIKEELVAKMPEQEETFEANYQDLVSRLESLDSNFHDTIEGYDQNEILVSHAAYGYWEKAYGIEQLAISGITSSDEPSQKELENIIEEVEENDIHYLFFEQNITPKVATVIQQETGVESLELHNLSVLTEEDIDNSEDYFTLMERNLKAIETALAE